MKSLFSTESSSISNFKNGIKINVYCDESCHLEHDGHKAMALGAIWCPKDKIKEINHQIQEIKSKYNISKTSEVKWTKISPCNLNLYLELVDYFFDNNDLHFRTLVVPDKSKLNHSKYNQTHDQWYHKMYFELLKIWILKLNRTAKKSNLKTFMLLKQQFYFILKSPILK